MIHFWKEWDEKIDPVITLLGKVCYISTNNFQMKEEPVSRAPVHQTMLTHRLTTLDTDGDR